MSCLLLSMMVGTTNASKTFPLAYCYITIDSAKFFDFGELTKYVFYNCLGTAVICADFTKGLRAVIAACALCESIVRSKAA
jgi:surface polysaccharide O-acyltransferase-like enzyme